MTRPTTMHIDADALLHNLQVVQDFAEDQQVIAMVKANAYGCGIDKIVPLLAGKVYAFGVACIEEAERVLQFAQHSECILFQGVFSETELQQAYSNGLQLVIHQQRQLEWVLQNPCSKQVKVWVKINTGMHRLGFLAEEVDGVLQQLMNCDWVSSDISILTHFACADIKDSSKNIEQLDSFHNITSGYPNVTKSMANSAAILGLPESHSDVVRAGIMLYGVSPIMGKTGQELGLKPVMHFESEVSEIHHYPAHAAVGYGSLWESDAPSVIGVVPVGYADGYPRCINTDAKVWVAGNTAPIVGRISMDMLTIDLTACKNVEIGSKVELWGKHITADSVALTAGTIGHEIIARIGSRVIRK